MFIHVVNCDVSPGKCNLEPSTCDSCLLFITNFKIVVINKGHIAFSMHIKYESRKCDVKKNILLLTHLSIVNNCIQYVICGVCLFSLLSKS